MNKINIDNRYLNLDQLNINDSFEELIDKFNRNFVEIQTNGGGPRGPLGPQGESIPGPPGPPGPKGEDGDSQWSALDGINGCSVEMEGSLEDEIADMELLVNTYSNKSILLTNLYDGETGVLTNTSFDTQHLSSAMMNTLGSDFKLKIYSSDSAGEGKHIHLMNSALASSNNHFICQSGFNITNDKTGPVQETLRITGNKNSNIVNHSLLAEITSDRLDMKNQLGGQHFSIEVESALANDNGNKFLVKEQSVANITRVPDRTGWNAVWEDTNETAETWEIIYHISDAAGPTSENEITVSEMTYNVSGTSSNIVLTGAAESELPIRLTDNSYIRFKRMNNWVLVDYRVEIIKTLESDFDIKNLVFKANKATVGCSTVSWHPGTFITTDTLDNEVDNYFSHFKVVGDLITGTDDQTFKIQNKFSFSPLKMRSDTNKYYVAGQVWATMTDNDPICEMLNIVIE